MAQDLREEGLVDSHKLPLYSEQASYPGAGPRMDEF